MSAATWLGKRLEGVPEELAEALRRLVADRPDDPRGVGWTLGAAAVAALERVAAGAGGRDAALDLLAADAALTYAFEAAAAEGAELGELAEALGVSGDLGLRLERAVRVGAGESGAG